MASSPTRLLVLGAGRHQKRLIQRAEQRGFEVVVSDFYPDSPGKAFASHPTMTDTTDIAANVELGRRFGVAGVITTGTDQPLVTMAEVAHALGLPCTLTPEAARRATDKRDMRRAYAAAGVPQPAYAEVAGADEAVRAAARLAPPLVIKPADSQGQRGISRVDAAGDVRAAAERAIVASRASALLVEQFFGGLELTVSAWAHAGEPQLLLVADRVTYNPLPTIGICFQHVTPSRRAAGLLDRLHDVTRGVMRAVGVQNGPLYIQMLVKDGEVLVVEGACRVGGGHEASLIPLISGVDLTDRLIDLAVTGACEPVAARPSRRDAAVTFLFGRAGVIAAQHGLAETVARGLVVEGEWYKRPGDRTSGMVDGQGRVGYFIATGRDRADLGARVREIYGQLAVTGEGGRGAA